MLKLLFTYNHELIFFTIDNKKIKYFDRKWPIGINFIPKDQDFARKVIMSRNRIANEMIRWINDANSGKNLEEWQSCKDDYEVAEVIKKESKLKGCVFRKLFTEEELNQQGLNVPPTKLDFNDKSISEEAPQEEQGEEVEYETEQITDEANDIDNQITEEVETEAIKNQ
jgi:hypothetical protein